jgi:CTP:molybdopterin cytidylyltransferase MocA
LEQPKVTTVIFEGGQARTSLDLVLRDIRKQVVLDTLSKLCQAPEVDQVLLVTNYDGLASEAAEFATVDFEPNGRRFHFGTRLRQVIVKYGLENVIYMGGAAAPLISPCEFNQIALALKRSRNTVIMNNVQSADLVAFTPARAIDEIELPDNDNSLGNLLRGIGMSRMLVPNSGRVNFDIDTPTDILILGLHPDCGARLSRAIASLDWPRDKLNQAIEILRDDSREIAVIGRVGPSVIQYINANMVHRMRVFSEERGMKALGREERGEVVSLLGFMIEELGPCKFFEYLSSVCDLAFIDTRVIFAHLQKQVSDWDRFQSDLGRFQLIENQWVKEFTRSAWESPIPVILGGHSLVAAGLWILAEMVAKEKDESGYRHNTFIMPRW